MVFCFALTKQNKKLLKSRKRKSKERGRNVKENKDERIKNIEWTAVAVFL